MLPKLHSGEVSEKESKAVENIQSASATLARMVDDLLDLSQLESRRMSMQRRWIDPHEVIHRIVERLSHVAAGHRLSVTESGVLAPVYADETRIEQILGNLISNAVKYGETGTEIRIEAAQRDHEIEISVTNHGRGIPPEEVPHLFQRFSRSEETRTSKVPGLGLGLYITKGLVEAQGGPHLGQKHSGENDDFPLHSSHPRRSRKARGVSSL